MTQRLDKSQQRWPARSAARVLFSCNHGALPGALPEAPHFCRTRSREAREDQQIHLQPTAYSLQPSALPKDRDMRIAGKARVSHRGFTLLELLVVIAMMIFIATIALVNYFGATRSSSYGAGEKNILSALQLARQRACVDGSPTYFCLIDATNYMIVRAGGSISNPQPDVPPPGVTLYDRYSDLSSLPSSGSIIDMDRDVSATIAQVKDSAYDAATNWYYEIHVTNCVGKDASGTTCGWLDGDRYGFQLHATQVTPKGFYLGLGMSYPYQQPVRSNIKFQPDGSATWSSDFGATCKFSLVEKLKEDKPDNRVVFTVESSGKIY